MANVAYTTLFGEVLPDLPHCPVDIATNAIRNAVIEFCDRSQILQFEATLITPVDGQADYTIPGLPTGTVVARILKAWYDGFEIEPKDGDALNQMYGDWRGLTGGTPRFITMTPPDLTKVTLVPPPANPLAGVIFRIRVALRPTRASTDFDPNVAETYAEDIAHGAKARLMAIPGKPYSNERLAAYHSGAFNAGITKAIARANKGMTRESLSVQFRKL